MIAHGALEMRQRRGERAVLRDAVAETREQVFVHGGQIDAEHTAVAGHRPAADDQLLDVARGRARKEEIERIEIGAQPVGIERIPVDAAECRPARRASARRLPHC